MRVAAFVLTITMVLALTLALSAQLPQQDLPQQNQQQQMDDKVEAAHGRIISSRRTRPERRVG